MQRLRALAPLLALALAACSGGSDETASGAKPAAGGAAAASPAPPEESAEQQLVAEGRHVYMANCIACHNPDPSQAGGLGPDVAGSPRALVEARVLRAEYPPGYTPKRDTHAMIALPHLAGEIDALTAFLDDAARAKN